MVLGALPRGKHVKPLVSEYGTYINVIINAQADEHLQSFVQTLPKGANIQSRLVITWGCVRDALDRQVKKCLLAKKLAELKKSAGEQIDGMNERQFLDNIGCHKDSNYKILLGNESECKEDDLACEKVVVAVPREPMDFLARAVEAGHPRSVSISLPSDLKKVMEWNRRAPAYEIYKHRIEFVKYWSNRAQELKEEDGRMTASVPDHLKKLLKGKRLAVWQAMLEHYNYPDVRLIDDIRMGFPVTGWLPNSNVFPQDPRAPSFDVNTLRSLRPGLNAHVKAKVRAAGSDELAETTWEETQKELAEGWMELDSSNVEGASWAMRFGLKQREKVRVIDDFSIAGVNQTAGMSERLKIFGIDDIAALLAHSSDTCEGPHPQMLGKTIDLKSA